MTIRTSTHSAALRLSSFVASKSDYDAQPLSLTQNYRSTKHIISASNAVIEPARERMKADSPIEIDRRRSRDPDGGEWGLIDPVGQGRVQTLPVGKSPVKPDSSGGYCGAKADGRAWTPTGTGPHVLWLPVTGVSWIPCAPCASLRAYRCRWQTRSFPVSGSCAKHALCGIGW